jgi:hypothetical protein
MLFNRWAEVKLDKSSATRLALAEVSDRKIAAIIE